MAEGTERGERGWPALPLPLTLTIGTGGSDSLRFELTGANVFSTRFVMETRGPEGRSPLVLLF
jgi:hypothetical protein